MSRQSQAYSVRAEMMQSPSKWVIVLLLAIIGFFVFAFVWASLAELDEVTRGTGQVIPTSKVQLVQNLEGGIVEEILVREGDVVDKGQLLIRLNDTVLSSTSRENSGRYFSYLATTSRLKAEADGTELKFPDELIEQRPDLVETETALYDTRQAEMNAAISILEQQKSQREQEVAELESRRQQYQTSYNLASEEVKILSPLVKQGVASKVELLRLKREANQLKGELNSAQANIKKANSAKKEAETRIKERQEAFQSEARAQLNDTLSKQESVRETLTAAQDRVSRTNVVSPVSGVVKQLFVTTKGQVVKPGEPMSEIVPIEDTLLVEAEILPKDIAFLGPGQEAVVKVSAYDFLVYGGLDGIVENISPDSVVDDKGEKFFVIQVRTNKNYLEKAGKTLPIKPGMVVDVDILTGKKTVLQYLMKPLTRARYEALRER